MSQDFLDQPTPPSPVAVAARPRRRWRRWVSVAALLVFVVLGGLTVVAAARVASSLSVTQDAAIRANAAMRDGDFALADTALDDAQAAIAGAQSGLKLVPFLRIVPWVGTQIRGLDYTLAAGGETIGALRGAVAIAVDVQNVTRDAQLLAGVTDSRVPYGELSNSARVAMLEALHDAHPQLLTMQVKLQLARADVARLEELNVSPKLQEAVAPFVELIDELAATVDMLTPFSAAIPELAGLGEDRQFLLLFANNTELRPSGGFIGMYGLAVTRDGEVIGMTTDSSQNVDNLVDDGYQVAAPAPLVTYLGTPKWYFRDSNWSPDFLTSAKDSVQLLRQEIAYSGQPVPEVHGVFLLTPTFMGRLLDVVGPVEIDGTTFTSANIADKLEYQVEAGYAGQEIPAHQRKDVIARMADVVVDRMLDLPSSSWPSMFTVMAEGFAQKEMALWSADEDIQATYVDADWAGQMHASKADDTLMVVDANLAALKTDPEVDRTIAYSIEPTSVGYEATVAITYDHNGSFTWKTTRYQTYTRVYVPLGSTFVSSSAAGDVTVIDELGFTSFGAFISIEPGASGTLSFTYLLTVSVGDAIESGLYELEVIKQLGAADHRLTLDLDVNRNVVRANPGEDASAWGDDRYTIDTVLETDMTFSVRM